MAQSALSKKMLIKEGQRVAVINAPPGFVAMFQPLPASAELVETVAAPVDFVLLFAQNADVLDVSVPQAIAALKAGGLLWIAYPKGGSKVKTDLNRDILWEKMKKFGLAGVSLVSVDRVWSAMRFRHSNEVGK